METAVVGSRDVASVAVDPRAVAVAVGWSSMAALISDGSCFSSRSRFSATIIVI